MQAIAKAKKKLNQRLLRSRFNAGLRQEAKKRGEQFAAANRPHLPILREENTAINIVLLKMIVNH